jgi:thiol-disulfide isomerase/thioredoxin
MLRTTALIAAILFCRPVHAETVAIYFTATWCPHCREMAPAVAAVRNAGYPIKVVDADSSEGQGLIAATGVKTIPATVIVDVGQDAEGKPTAAVKERQQKKLTSQQLVSLLKKHGVVAKSLK